MDNRNSIDPILLDYMKKIKINTYFDEQGKDINEVMKSIVLRNCIPEKIKKVQL